MKRSQTMTILFSFCCLAQFGLNLLGDPGRNGHGGEWRTSCSEREAGTAKKSRTGTVKAFGPHFFLSLQTSKIAATSFSFPHDSNFPVERSCFRLNDLNDYLKSEYCSFCSLPIYLNVCFFTYGHDRPDAKEECRLHSSRKDWIWCVTPDWSSRLQVPKYPYISLPCKLVVRGKRFRHIMHCSSWFLHVDFGRIIDVVAYSLPFVCRIFASTWNVGGKSPSKGLDLDEWLHSSPPADIYILGYVLPEALSFWTTLCSTYQWTWAIVFNSCCMQISRNCSFECWKCSWYWR